MHHISDVDTWGNPDRSYYMFVVLTVLCGFIGLDHFYLRSFGTGTQKALVNIFTFGFWYWWDLIQVFRDGKHIRKEGLNSPLDWIQGIGRGTFVPLPTDTVKAGGAQAAAQAGGAQAVGATGAPQFASEKSYLVYAVLAIFFGWLGADKFYMGEGWQGMAKILSCFNIFLFLFGWLWVAWDAFHAFFMTDTLMKEGISAPMPYSMLFSSTIDPDVFKVKEVEPLTKNANVGMLDWIAKIFHFPSVPQGFSMRNVYREILAPLMIPPVIKGIQEISHPSSTSSTSSPNMTNMTNMTNSTTNNTNSTNSPSVEQQPMSSVEASFVGAKEGVAANMAVQERTIQNMAGGGRNSMSSMSEGPGPVIAGALTAVVLAGGLKGFYDFILKQYG